MGIEGESLIPLVDADSRVLTSNDVRMVSEHVDINIEILDEPIYLQMEDADGYLYYHSRAHVTAAFVLENESNSEIRNFSIGFPEGKGDRNLLELDPSTEEYSVGPTWETLRSFSASIEGQEVESQTVDVNYKNSAESEPWSVWTMDFGSAGSNTATRNVVVEYDIYSSDSGFYRSYGIDALDNLSSSLYVSNARFYYVLRTGRGWKGKIDSSIIRMRFPEEVELAQKIIEVESDSEYCQTADCDPVTFSAFQIHPSDYRVDAENNTLVWERTDWNPKANLSSYDEDYAGDDIVIEFMYPETLAFFDEHFETKSTTPLAELSEPFDYGDTNDDNDGQGETETDEKSESLFQDTGALAILIAAVAGLAIGTYWRNRRDKKQLQ